GGVGGVQAHVGSLAQTADGGLPGERVLKVVQDYHHGTRHRVPPACSRRFVLDPARTRQATLIVLDKKSWSESARPKARARDYPARILARPPAQPPSSYTAQLVSAMRLPPSRRHRTCSPLPLWGRPESGRLHMAPSAGGVRSALRYKREQPMPARRVSRRAVLLGAPRRQRSDPRGAGADRAGGDDARRSSLAPDRAAR